MDKLNERKRRFDDTFKTFLIIATITMSFSITFYKDFLGISFFIEFFTTLVASIIFWGIFNLFGGFYEYLGKLYAWHFLTFNMVTSFIRLILGKVEIPRLIRLPCLIVILGTTILVKHWLEEVKAIPSSEYTISKSFIGIIGIWTIFQLGI